MLSELLTANIHILQKTNSYMLPRLHQLIGMLACLENTAGSEYTNAFKRTEMPKGSYLVQAGSVCRHFWILEKGIARMFVCKKSIERNQYFFFPSEIIDSFGNSALQEPSRACIQLLEDSVVYSIPKSRLAQLTVANPLIADIEKLLRDCHINWVEERLCNIQFLSAPQHYYYLMATQPYMISHISLNHLSSYLGITRETLSRIRHIRFEQAMAAYCMWEMGDEEMKGFGD